MMRAQSRCSLLPSGSETESHAKLQLPRSSSLRQSRHSPGPGSDLRRVRVDRERRRDVVVLDVEHVERLETQLQFFCFSKLKTLEHGKIHVHDMRPAKY